MTFNLFELSRLIREMDKTRELSIYHLGTMKTFSPLGFSRMVPPEKDPMGVNIDGLSD